MKSYHNQLREKYSIILSDEINNNPTLSHLSDGDRDLLFHELSNWFGTSPPEHSRVKKHLKEIITKKINYKDIKLEMD